MFGFKKLKIMQRIFENDTYGAKLWALCVQILSPNLKLLGGKFSTEQTTFGGKPRPFAP